MAVHRNQHGILRTLNLPRRVVGSPVIWPFYLLAVSNFLAKKTVLIVDSITKSRHSQCGQGIQKTGGESTQAAISESRICLVLFNFCKIDAEFQQNFPAAIQQSEVHKIVAQ